MANEAEQAIYNRLAGAPTFHPANAAIFATDWGLDAGDVVAVRSGSDTFNVPVYGMNLNWKGASQVEIRSTGNQERKPLSALKRRQYGGGSAAHKEIEEQGTVIEARFIQDETKIGFVVEEKDGGLVVNAAHVAAGINAQDKTSSSYVDILADYIDLTGYVTASYVDAEKAKINELTSQTGYLGTIRASGISTGGNITASGAIIGSGIYIGSSAPYTSVANAIASFGTATTAQDGTVTIPTTTLGGTAGPNINFKKAGAIDTITATNSQWLPAMPNTQYGGFRVTITASGQNLTPMTDTVDIDAAYAYSAGWSEGYDDCEAEFSHATVTPQGAPETVYVEDSNGTNYYRSGSSVTRVGTSVRYSYYGTLYYQNASGTGYVSIGTGTWYMWSSDHRSDYLYQAGSSVTPISTSSRITIKEDTRYAAGTTDTTTYYTRS